jgi:hypothetical protein
MPRTWQGVDPASQRTGAQAWGEIESTWGQPLGSDWQQYAANLIGYTDPTGQAPISGSQYNQLLQQAAGRAGEQFNPWAAPVSQPAPPPIGGPPSTGGGISQYLPDPIPHLPASGSVDELYGPPGRYGPSGPAAPVDPLAGWPALERSASDYPTYTTPPLNLPAAWAPPSWATVQQDPGVEFRRRRGEQAIENRASSLGNLRTGGTMKGLIDYAGESAGQEYGAAVDRSLQAYDRAVDAATLGYRAGLDVRDFAFQRDLSADERAFRNRAFEEERAYRNRTYQSGEERWRAEFAQRAYEFKQTDEFKRAVYADDQTYRAARDRESDAWKREVMEEERRRFLAELGTR